MLAFDWAHSWAFGPVSFGLGFAFAVVLLGWRDYSARQREREREWRDGWSAGYRQGSAHARAFSEGGEYGPLVARARRREWARHAGESEGETA